MIAACGSAPAPSQKPRTVAARVSTTGTKTPATLSARRCARALPRLCLGDQVGDAGQPGVGADRGGPHRQQAADVHAAADHGRAGSDLGRFALPGDQGEVDGRTAFDDGAVGGHAFPGPYDEDLARPEVLDRDAALARVVAYGDLLGGQFRQ